MAPLFFLLLLLLLPPNSIIADTDPSDVSALNAMYQSLNSPGQLTEWSSSGGDPCDENWKGITCSGSRVTEINLSSLGLSGGIGYQLSSLTSVTNFDVSNNNFGNQIPYSLPPNVTRLNLAGCGFSGTLPYSISQMTSLKFLNVARNQISGPLPDMFGQLSALNSLDLSSNAFMGDLPESFSLLSSATDMFLQNNQFTGTIDVLANLPLKNLNVANNKFTGWVPTQLNNINLQKDGNSWSSGPAPPPPPGTPAAERGGQNRQPGGSSPSAGGSSGGGGGKKSGVGGGAIAGIVISILVVSAIIAFFLLKKRSKKSSTDIEKTEDHSFPYVAQQSVEEMKPDQASSMANTKTFETEAVIDLKPPPFDHQKSFDDDGFSAIPITPKKVHVAPPDVTSFSVADLQLATNSFSADNLIGEGSIGRVFRAQFEDGKVVAVKKIISSASSDDFIDVVSSVSRLLHPNITELIGYCSEHGQHLLVYEFLKNGSLYDFLHLADEYSKPLIWNTRVKIALGTARALEYLHEICSPSVIHKNIKSANILLDSELNPHLSECGLASLISDADQNSGYSAPEVSMSGQYTMKSDVYSFGVTMLELLTGRKPFDSSRTRAEQSLVRWATPQLHDMDALAKMVDPALKGLYPVKSLSRFADVIALCVQPEPEFRPAMSEVVQALVRLVQRANMSKRTVGVEQGRSGNQEFTP
ncbi:putative non-specific protein-tyrosine kinase RLK-Pelle-LRR-V family [Helianthus anomalus]